jgi:hypothetical protein
MNPAIVELTVEEMLADPIVQLLMKSDNIVADDVRPVIREARRRRDVHLHRPLRRAQALAGGHLMDFHKMRPANTVARVHAFTSPDIEGGC